MEDLRLIPHPLIQKIMLFVSSDEIIFEYLHSLPTSQKWQEYKDENLSVAYTIKKTTKMWYDDSWIRSINKVLWKTPRGKQLFNIQGGVRKMSSPQLYTQNNIPFPVADPDLNLSIIIGYPSQSLMLRLMKWSCSICKPLFKCLEHMPDGRPCPWHGWPHIIS